MAKERLHKALARAGVASRRQVEKMIEAGMVRVNNKTVAQLGMVIDTDTDKVHVEGKQIPVDYGTQSDRFYFLLNKPESVLSTTVDNTDRKTVIDLIKGLKDARVYPVGRLDYDAEGALLLTNDGELTNKLIHPKFHVEKVYEVKVKGVPSEESLDKLRRGIYLEDGPTGPCQIEVLRKVKANTWVKVILTQGKNRQIKRMFWRIEHPVQRLIRTHFAGISVNGIRPGEFRELGNKELSVLKAMVEKK